MLLAALLPTAAFSAALGKVSRGQMALLQSNLAHGNVLPQYRWMCKMSGAEFAESGYCRVSNATGSNFNKPAPISSPCSVEQDPSCPDSVFAGLWQDLRTMTLPYTVQDVYDRAQTPTQVDVLLLENDELSATVTPQWGGKLWGLRSKITGKDLFLHNGAFQPTNDALRQAYVQGGSEWNFGTQIGHASSTQSDVYAAALPTERGDILRVYDFDRIGGGVWQVDMHIGSNQTLWVHVKLTNPGTTPMLAYWWTCVAVNWDLGGVNRTRILTPAEHWIADGGVIAALPPWPFFHERGTGLMQTAWENASSSGDWVYPSYPRCVPL